MLLRRHCLSARRYVVAAARARAIHAHGSAPHSSQPPPQAPRRAAASPSTPYQLRTCVPALIQRRQHARGVAAATPAGLSLPQILSNTCPGCGVRLQTVDPDQPGFFQVPKRLTEQPPSDEETYGAQTVPQTGGGESPSTSRTSFAVEEEDDEEDQEPVAEPAVAKPVVCARCYALQHYGRVKSVAAEALLPGFDFDAVVGSRLRAAAKRTRPVVVLVVDLSDFDGSFPASAATTLNAIGDGVHVILACTKADLLPRSASPARLDSWARVRARQGGLSIPLTSLQLVGSPVKYGVSALGVKLEELATSRSGSDVWVVGAQNAGKSTLINALAAHYGNSSGAGPVASHVAGTTLGLVRLDGVLPGNRTLVDTPGVAHPHQLASRLGPDDARLILPRKPLRPRTFRTPVGSTVSAGALFRVDVLECSSGQTVYLTLWLSTDISTHLGRTQTADALLDAHAGTRLKPPVGDLWCQPEHRRETLGRWVSRTLRVSGSSWASSSCDVAIAGVGWVAVGVDGDATLRVWTYDGVAVTQRSPPLVPDLARQLETPGFDFEQSGKSAGGREVKGNASKGRR